MGLRLSIVISVHPSGSRQTNLFPDEAARTAQIAELTSDNSTCIWLIVLAMLTPRFPHTRGSGAFTFEIRNMNLFSNEPSTGSWFNDFATGVFSTVGAFTFVASLLLLLFLS